MILSSEIEKLYTLLFFFFFFNLKKFPTTRPKNKNSSDNLELKAMREVHTGNRLVKNDEGKKFPKGTLVLIRFSPCSNWY